VSTDVQVDTGHSLDMQRDRLELYCKAYNLEIADVLVDEGISGGIPLHKRPEGSKLVEMARKKEITHVVAYSLTRLFRDVVDGLTWG
jgi:Resolvase, N terminal domain.